MNVTVIYNPHSGTSSDLGAIKAAFAAHNVRPTYLPIDSKLLHRQVKAETAKKGAVIVAAGGDGTVSAVAGMVQATNAKFGIIASGTLNHFAKDLGLPLTITDAVQVILAGKTTKVDAAQVNDRVFVNNASIGLYPLSLRTRAQFDGQIGKWPAAVVGVCRALVRPRRYRVTLTIDGKKITRRTPFVFIGNNQYKFNKPPFVRRDRLNEGILGVYIIKANSGLAVVRMFMHTLFTKKRKTDEFEIHKVSELTIATKKHRQLHVAFDGEVATMDTPLWYRSLPGSLRVIVP